MLLSEIMSRPVLEMAYRKKKAEAVITGLEKPINTHLLKLLAVPAGQVRADNLEHWKGELVNWLDEVAEIRLKPDNRPGHPGFYFGILFDEPFGGSEVAGVASRLKRLARGPDAVPIRGDLDPTEVAARLRAFHAAFDAGCTAGRQTIETTEAMVDQLAAGD
jgi:hypothetical protein